VLTPAGWKVEGLAVGKLSAPSFRVAAGVPLRSAWFVPVVALVGRKPKLKYRPTTPTVFDEAVANADGTGSSFRVPPLRTTPAVPSESVPAAWVLKPSRVPPVTVKVPVMLLAAAALTLVSFKVPALTLAVRFAAVTGPLSVRLPVVSVS